MKIIEIHPGENIMQESVDVIGLNGYIYGLQNDTFDVYINDEIVIKDFPVLIFNQMNLPLKIPKISIRKKDIVKLNAPSAMPVIPIEKSIVLYTQLLNHEKKYRAYIKGAIQQMNGENFEILIKVPPYQRYILRTGAFFYYRENMNPSEVVNIKSRIKAYADKNLIAEGTVDRIFYNPVFWKDMPEYEFEVKDILIIKGTPGYDNQSMTNIYYPWFVFVFEVVKDKEI